MNTTIKSFLFGAGGGTGPMKPGNPLKFAKTLSRVLIPADGKPSEK